MKKTIGVFGAVLVMAVVLVWQLSAMDFLIPNESNDQVLVAENEIEGALDTVRDNTALQDYDVALPILEELYAEYPTHPDVLWYLGVFNSMKGDLQQSQKYFEEIEVKTENVHMNLAEINLANGDKEASLQNIAIALEKAELNKDSYNDDFETLYRWEGEMKQLLESANPVDELSGTSITMIQDSTQSALFNRISKSDQTIDEYSLPYFVVLEIGRRNFDAAEAVLESIEEDSYVETNQMFREALIGRQEKIVEVPETYIGEAFNLFKEGEVVKAMNLLEKRVIVAVDEELAAVSFALTEMYRLENEYEKLDELLQLISSDQVQLEFKTAYPLSRYMFWLVRKGEETV